MSNHLPDKPNLEFLKKQAKELRRTRGGTLADAQKGGKSDGAIVDPAEFSEVRLTQPHEARHDTGDDNTGHQIDRNIQCHV